VINVEHLAGYARRMIVDQPFWATTHVHKHDHWTILESGTVEVEYEITAVRSFKATFEAPAAILISAGKQHTIRSLTGNVRWLCIHTFPMGSDEAETLGITMDNALIAEE